MRGYRFQVFWRVTGYVKIENGANQAHAAGKVKRFAERRGALYVRYLGETEPIPADHRVVSATGVPLRKVF